MKSSEACGRPAAEAATVEHVRRLAAEAAAVVAELAGRAEEIARIGAVLVDVLRRGGKVLTAGNGGSAAEAMHMAEELVGRFRANRRSLPAVALVADGTALTCIGNDFGFDHIFSRQVEGLGKAGDLLCLFSTSGNAPNLRRALDAARGQGLVTVCFLGRDGGAVAGLADHQFIVAASVTERVQEAHQVLIHVLLDLVEQAFPAG